MLETQTTKAGGTSRGAEYVDKQVVDHHSPYAVKKLVRKGLITKSGRLSVPSCVPWLYKGLRKISTSVCMTKQVIHGGIKASKMDEGMEVYTADFGQRNPDQPDARYNYHGWEVWLCGSRHPW